MGDRIKPESVIGMGQNMQSVLESMGTAGMVALARNVRVVLKGGTMSNEERQKLIKHGVASAGTAGLFSLILG